MNVPVWKILFVEDSEDDYVLTRAMLADVRPRRFDLTWAQTCDIAFTALEKETPDVMIVDYDLGGCTGLEFIHKARSRGVKAPAILLTGYPSYAIDVEAMKAGVSDFLDKGQISGPYLERVIRYTIERTLILERLEQMNEDLEQRVQERTRELEEGNRLLDRAFATIHLMLAYLDRDFNFIRVNENYAQADGRPVSFFPGKNHFALYPNAENEAIFRRVVETGQPFYAFARPLAYPKHTGQGTTYWDWSLQPVKEPDGRVSGLILSLLNVTDQERMRAALKTTEARLSAVVNSAPLIVWSMSTEGVIDLAEGRGLARLGLTPQEVVGERIQQVLTAYPEVAVDLERALRGEECRTVITINEQVFHGVAGEVLETSFSPLMNAEGAFSGVIGVTTFITERVKAEERARQAVDRLEAQAQLSHLLGEARLDLDVILSVLAQRIAELIGDACVVTRISEDGQYLEPVAFYHRQPEGRERMDKMLRSSRTRVGEGYSGIAAQMGIAVIVEDPSTGSGSQSPDFQPLLDAFDVCSALIVPLKVGDRVFGTLGVTRDNPGSPYTSEDQVFLEALAGRAALWIANADLFGEVQRELAERKRVEAELNEIQSRLYDGAETERLELAREIHDGPIQELYGIQFQLRGLEETVPGGSENEDMAAVQAAVQQVIDSLRATSMELRPPALTRFGLEPTLRSHVEQVRKMQPGLAIRLEMEPDCDRPGTPNALSERVRLTLFRLCQMALTNVVRHAHASQVTIRLGGEGERVRAEIRDNGVGFQVPRRWVELARGGHLGLVGAMERVDALGGKMTVTSQPGAGTTIQVELPRQA